VDENSDPDNDGIPTGLEVQFGVDPLKADTDGDGIPDRQEWGTEAGQLKATPDDTDGDSHCDAAESASADADLDCIPDQLDADDSHAQDPSPLLVPLVCPSVGVCATMKDALSVECIGGVPVCVPPPPPAFELLETRCDGLDNDCDGQTDEGIYTGKDLLGQPCIAPGECGEGTVECSSTAFVAVCSSGPLGSASKVKEEICDLLDNDCDGVTDNGMLWQDVPVGDPCTAAGECGPGTVECRVDIAIPVCSSMPGGTKDASSEELCDALDNDCDGATDEQLFSPDLSACPHTGVCGDGQSLLKVYCMFGTWLCDPSAVPGFNPETEALCDGLDNDCDGATDEDFQLSDLDGSARLIGQPCGLGACAGGQVECSPDGLGLTCSSWTGILAEACDGVDNDCDSAVDEGLLYDGKALGEPCLGIGNCGAGTVECSKTSLAPTCSTNADGSDSDAVAEKCDNKDNDCDGQTDEGVAPDTDPCVQTGVCSNSSGAASCVLGEWQCDYGFIPDWEAVESICDGLDNDCDQAVDEGKPKQFDSKPTLSRTMPPARGAYAWTIAPDMDVLFVSGGLARPYPTPSTPVALADLWMLDLSSLQWAQAMSGPVEARSAHTVSWDPTSASLVVLGGVGQQSQFLPAWRWFPFQNAFEQLPLPNAVSEREGHAAFVRYDTGDLYVIGGQGKDGPAPPLAVSKESGAVTPIPDAPARTYAATCQDPLTGVGFLFGGVTPSGTLSKGFFRFIPASLDVSEIVSLQQPPERKLATLACLPGEVLLFGGADASGAPLGDAWVFDIDSGLWAPLPFGPPAREQAVASRESGLLTVRLGIGKDGRFLPDAWAYGDGGWTQTAAEGPWNVAAAATTVDPVGRRLCMAGGFESGTSGLLPAGFLWCYSLDSGTWQELAPLSSPAIFASLSFDPNQNRLLLVGSGQFTEGGVPDPERSACRYEAFDFDSGEWSDFEDCLALPPQAPPDISAHAAAVRWKDLSLWVAGGVVGNSGNEHLYRYALDSKEWEMLDLTPPLPPRVGPAAILREGTGDLVLAGGKGAGDSIVIVNLDTLTWTPVVSFPDLSSAFPSVAFDPTSQQLLFVHADSPAATQITLVGSEMQGLLTLPFPGTVIPTTSAQAWFDPLSRSAIWLGGIDAAGLPRSDMVYLPMVCKQ
jgi:hypothetical protein